jgi:tungstate transport system ATP-binding protein
MADRLLSLTDVRVRREKRIILDVPSLDVSVGDILAVVGPNGSGKSTLLQVMAFLLAPDAGCVRFHDQPIDARRNPIGARRRMAMVFQDPLLFDTSVFDNVASGLRLRGVRGSELRTRVAPWLERLGIAGLARRPARTLSGGEARRTSLARALVLEPELLFLDEPFGALDYLSRQALLAELPPLLAAARTTTVLVTHDPLEAQSLASRAVALAAGRVVAEGAVDVVLAAAGLALPPRPANAPATASTSATGGDGSAARAGPEGDIA